LLTHAFFRSNLDNVVAAIISPNSTKSIRKKLRNEPDAIGVDTERTRKPLG
jgi:hypothetical protein